MIPPCDFVILDAAAPPWDERLKDGVNDLRKDNKFARRLRSAAAFAASTSAWYAYFAALSFSSAIELSTSQPVIFSRF